MDILLFSLNLTLVNQACLFLTMQDTVSELPSFDLNSS